MKKIFISIIILFIGYNFLMAQSIKGKVYFIDNENKENGSFSLVWWLEGKSSVEADENGEFEFKNIKGDNITLIASYIGYSQDTIQVVSNGKNNFPQNFIEFNLYPDNLLDGAVVRGRQEGTYLSKTNEIKTEVITAAGLCKMACCSLAESFESSASVSVGYSDAVTGARQIKLLGLSGSYTQMLDENRPTMRGLATPFGLNYIPGQWLESIQIAKGPSSVVNGLEAITGQINVEHRKPTAENPLFVNLFVNSRLRGEANVASSLQLNDKWSTVIMGHLSGDTKKHDENGDGFRDDPLTKQFNLDNRWLYVADNGTQIRFGVKGLNDSRIGGQMGYSKGMNDRDGDLGEAYNKGIWGSEVNNKGVNGYLKVGLPLNEENTQNLAFVTDYSYFKMDSNFGLKDFNGEQNMLFVNAMYQNQLNDSHKVIFGLSGRYDNITQNLQQLSVNTGKPAVTDLSITDKVVGGYGEYTFISGEKFTFVAGLRGDYSSKYGWLFAPRSTVKYSITENTIFRGNIGRGFRNPNIIPDNLGLLSNGRRIVIDEEIKVEDAWTFGGNFTQYFNLGAGKNSYISFDYFRTTFNSQMVVDWDKGYNTNTVNVYNCGGKSFTDTYQLDLSVEPFERFNAIATFRYANAKLTMQQQGLVDMPLTSKYKGVLNLQYATRMDKWIFDFTAQINGPCSLPQFMGGEKTEVFPMFYAQVTKKFRGLDIYVGGENLGNYLQKNPIIEAKNPFSEKFNASMVWGPLMGRMIYAGMRLTLWK